MQIGSVEAAGEGLDTPERGVRTLENDFAQILVGATVLDAAVRVDVD